MTTRLSVRIGGALSALALVLLTGCGRNLGGLALGNGSLGICGLIAVVLAVMALIDLAGSSRSTGDKLLWAAVIFFFPIVGSLIYYFIGRR